MTLTIRKAKEKDVTILAELSRKTFKEAFSDQNDPGDMQTYLDTSFSVEQIAQELTHPEILFLMAFHQDILVGYAKIQGGPKPDCVGDANAIQLSRIYICSQYKDRGFGSLLIQACLDESRHRGYETVWLGVWEKNIAAQKFYERRGFIREGTKTFVLGSDVQQDAVYTQSTGEPLPEDAT